MEKVSTAQRLKEVMEEKNLRQIDIVSNSKLYEKEIGTKISKSDLSQYLSGKTEPTQKKLYLLALMLDVSEAWLMGFPVPKKRIPDEERFQLTAKAWNESHKASLKLNETEYNIIKKYRMMDSYGKKSVETIVNMEYTRSKSQANIMDSEDLLAAHSSGKLTDEQLKAIDDFKNSEE